MDRSTRVSEGKVDEMHCGMWTRSKATEVQEQEWEDRYTVCLPKETEKPVI